MVESVNIGNFLLPFLIFYILMVFIISIILYFNKKTLLAILFLSVFLNIPFFGTGRNEVFQLTTGILWPLGNIILLLFLFRKLFFKNKQF